MSTELISISIKITGRVQGVWFRASAKNEADRLGLQGIVKNLPDGRVYIAVSGNLDAIDAFISWCHTGPELARVESVEVVPTDPMQYQGFEVDRS